MCVQCEESRILFCFYPSPPSSNLEQSEAETFNLSIDVRVRVAASPDLWRTVRRNFSSLDCLCYAQPSRLDSEAGQVGCYPLTPSS